jgi:hypothetical protein
MSEGQEQLLHLVEAAQREGLSEEEIGELVADAVDADADVKRAA